MDSALSFSPKRTILTQECLRRLRNTKIELGPDVQKKHLDEFMLKLKVSKYSPKFRTEVLDSALKAFEKVRKTNYDLFFLSPFGSAHTSIYLN